MQCVLGWRYHVSSKISCGRCKLDVHCTHFLTTQEVAKLPVINKSFRHPDVWGTRAVALEEWYDIFAFASCYIASWIARQNGGPKRHSLVA